MNYDYDRRQAARPIPIDKPALAKLAKELVRELPKHMRFKPSDMEDTRMSWCRGFTQNWGFDLGVYETTDVRGRYVGVPVRVGWENMEDWGPTRQWIAGGSVQHRSYGGGEASKYQMNVKVNAARIPKEMLAHLDRIEKEAFSVLIHETTHLRDLLKRIDAYQHAKETTEGYYNEPTEVRAFMQQTADEVIEFVEQQAKTLGGVGPWGITLSGRTLERALEMSTTWDRIRKHLNPSNEKLVIRGVERALRDEWPRLEKQYPAESIEDE